MSADFGHHVAYLAARRAAMDIKIGLARSGRDIVIPVQIDATWSPSDLFDVYCLVSYLSVRESDGWRLTPRSQGSELNMTLERLLLVPAIDAAVTAARSDGTSANVFEDLRHGRERALPGIAD